MPQAMRRWVFCWRWACCAQARAAGRCCWPRWRGRCCRWQWSSCRSICPGGGRPTWIWRSMPLARPGVLGRWHDWRERWLLPDARGAMVLLALWPPALLFPAAVPFGLGQVQQRLGAAGGGVFGAGEGGAAAGDGADRLAGPYPIDAVDAAARWPAIAPDRAGAAVPRRRAAMRRAGAAPPLPAGLLRDPPGAAPRAAAAGAGGTGRRAHGAVRRAELGPSPCLAVAEPARARRALGCAGAGLAAARPAAPGLRGHAAAGAGLAVGAAQPGAHQRLLCPDLAALGAGPLHPLLWPGPVARLALALCHIAVCAAAGIGPAAA